MMNIEDNVLEASLGRVVVNNTKCPGSSAMPQACTSLEYAILGHLDVISPGYRFVSKHHMTGGDPHFGWMIGKK